MEPLNVWQKKSSACLIFYVYTEFLSALFSTLNVLILFCFYFIFFTASCVHSFIKSYQGKETSALLFSYGPPELFGCILMLPDISELF